MLPITKIAEKAGIDDKYLEQYGKYKAKIDYNLSLIHILLTAFCMLIPLPIPPAT